MIEAPGPLKVLVISGASGGHIFPALAFLDRLKDRCKDTDILLVLPRDTRVCGIKNSGYKINYISISSLKLSLDFRNLIAILKFIRGTIETIFIILKFRPWLVVAFGSLACVPAVLWAKLFAIKTLIHEQNVIPGRANRFLARFADKIAISFDKTRGYLNNYSRKIVFTGNPLRKELKIYDRDYAFNFFGFGNNKFTVLVMGGSSGSHSINTGFLKAIPNISGLERLQVIHISGDQDLRLLEQNYKSLKVDARLFSFLDSIGLAYSVCDLVVCRAGATTIAELIYFKLPAIIIPYPYALRHQLENAQVLRDKGCAVIIEDKQLQSDILKQAINRFINNPEQLKTMRSNYDSIARPQADVLLVNAALSLN